MRNGDSWDTKQLLEKLIEQMRDWGMYDSPRLRLARLLLAAELARRKGDKETFNHLVREVKL